MMLWGISLYIRILTKHTLDKSLAGFAQRSLALSAFKYRSSNVLCNIALPALGGVKDHHPHCVGVLAAQDIANDRLFVGFCHVGFDIGMTQPFGEVIEHDVHSNIARLLAWSQWRGPCTHDTTLH